MEQGPEGTRDLLAWEDGNHVAGPCFSGVLTVLFHFIGQYSHI